jgi:Membrane-bound lysozyme-inhibitor of c-type lysozyme
LWNILRFSGVSEGCIVNHAHHTSRVVAATIAAVLLAACQRNEVPASAATPASPPPEAQAEPAPAPVVAPSEDEAPPPGVLRAYVWDCGGTTVRMRNLWRERAVALDLHDGTHKLNSTPSASGARYSDGMVTFWTKGSSATLETSGHPAVQCSELRVQSLLEDARLRGAVYRGMGNEPGWTLEIGPGNSLVWVTGYGQERHEYADALVSGDSATGFVYTATDAAGQITVTVQRSPCLDDMSGEAFDHRFTVATGATELRGCGNKAQP